MSNGRGLAEWDQTAAILATVLGIFGRSPDPTSLNPYRRTGEIAPATEEQKAAQTGLFMVGLEVGLKAFADSIRARAENGA